MKTTAMLAIAAVLGACGGTKTTTKEPAPALAQRTAAPAEAAPEAAPSAEPFVTIPDEPQPAPSFVLLNVVVPDPPALVEAGRDYAERVMPGVTKSHFAADDSVERFIDGALVGALEVDVDGFDAAAPMRVVGLSPDRAVKPFVLVVGVSDAEALRGSLEDSDLRAVVHRDRAAIGTPAALQQAAPYALTTLVAEPPGERARVELLMDNIRQLALPGLRKMRELAPQTADDEEHAKAMLQGIDMVLALLEQSAAVRVELHLDPEMAALEMVAEPFEDTTLAAVMSSQKPASYELAPVMANMDVVVAGWLEVTDMPDAVRKGLFPFGNSHSGLLEAFAEVSEGAMAFGLDWDDGVAVAFEWLVTDAREAVRVQREYFRSPEAVEGVETRAAVGAHRHRGVAIDRVVMKFTEEASREAHQMATGVFGEGGMVSYYAGLRDRLLMTFGGDAEDRLRARIDEIRRDETPSTPAWLEGAVTSAGEHGENLLAAFDVAGLMAKASEAMAAPPEDIARVLLGIGMTRGDFTLRIAVPPAQVRAIATAAMSGALDGL